MFESDEDLAEVTEWDTEGCGGILACSRLERHAATCIKYSESATAIGIWDIRYESGSDFNKILSLSPAFSPPSYQCDYVRE